MPTKLEDFESNSVYMSSSIILHLSVQESTVRDPLRFFSKSSRLSKDMIAPGVGCWWCLWLDSLNTKHEQKYCPCWFRKHHLIIPNINITLYPISHTYIHTYIIIYIYIYIWCTRTSLLASASVVCNAIMHVSATKSTNRPTKKNIPSGCVTHLLASFGLARNTRCSACGRMGIWSV